MSPVSALRAIKLIHTLAWAFFVACIFAIPYFAWRHAFDRVLIASGFVLLEIIVLVVNSMRCPLTAVAARHTTDRRANFDIYLPEPIARYNKEIFGSVVVVGWIFALYQWWAS